MIRTLPLVLGATAVALTACGAATAYDTPAAQPAQPAAHTAASSSAPVLKTASTSLGTIVVGGKGRTVYVYDADHKGTTSSACTGACRTAWPLVTFKGTAKTKIKVSGVTGKVGSIAVSKGVRQVTLAGWPLYYYAGDSAAGQANGEGSGSVWWVVNAKGTRVKQTASASTGSGGW